MTGVDDDIDDGNVIYEVITTVDSEDSFYNEDTVDLTVATAFDSSVDSTMSLLLDEINIQESDLSADTQLSFNNGAVFTVNSDATLNNSNATDVSLTLDTINSRIGVGNTATVNTTAIEVSTFYDGEAGTIGLEASDGSPLNISSGTQITFDNGAVITLDADYDSTVDDTVAVTLNSYTVSTENYTQFREILAADLTVTNNDNDTAGITVEVSDQTTSEGFSNDFLNIELNSQPTSEVTVTFSPIDENGNKDYNLEIEDEFAGQSYSITFDETDWNLPKAIEVTAVDDFDIEYDHTSYIDIEVSSADKNYDRVISFDGVNGDVEIPNTNDVFNLSTWTLQAWVKPFSDGTSNLSNPIIHKIAEDNTNQDTFYLSWNADNKFQVGLEEEEFGDDFSVTSEVHAVNAFHHVAATYDQTTGDLKIWR